MKLIIGLGNPGRQYDLTRHNVGFAVLDALAEQHNLAWKAVQQGQALITELDSPQRAVLAKPQTFMNLSGEAAADLVKKYHAPAESLWIVHDELDLPFGRLQLKVGGGTAGHNGLESIVDRVGFADFVRLRIGIGPTERPSQFDGASYVLQHFTATERASLPSIIDAATRALTAALADGVAAAMNSLNQNLNQKMGGILSTS